MSRIVCSSRARRYGRWLRCNARDPFAAKWLDLRMVMHEVVTLGSERECRSRGSTGEYPSSLVMTWRDRWTLRPHPLPLSPMSTLGEGARECCTRRDGRGFLCYVGRSVPEAFFSHSSVQTRYSPSQCVLLISMPRSASQSITRCIYREAFHSEPISGLCLAFSSKGPMPT